MKLLELCYKFNCDLQSSYLSHRRTGQLPELKVLTARRNKMSELFFFFRERITELERPQLKKTNKGKTEN